MKTPIEELIEKVNQWMLDDTEVLNNPLDYEEYMGIYANQMLSVKKKIIDMCKSMLEKEKEQIIDIWIDAYTTNIKAATRDNFLMWANNYYNETYNTNDVK